MITHIHHINFIVRDLDIAIKRFSKLLAGNEFVIDALEARAVKTARVKLGDTWLVLVQPTDPQGVPGKYLEANGEGFFLISLGTDDLDSQLAQMAKQDATLPLPNKRHGLDNWRVADLPVDAFFGAQFQLTEEVKS